MVYNEFDHQTSLLSMMADSGDHTNNGAMAGEESDVSGSDRMQMAFDAVREKKMTAYAASSHFHVSRTSLSRHLSKDHSGYSSYVHGAVPYLTSSQEGDLVDYIKEMARRGFSLNKDKIMALASSIHQLYVTQAASWSWCIEEMVLQAEIPFFLQPYFHSIEYRSLLIISTSYSCSPYII